MNRTKKSLKGLNKNIASAERQLEILDNTIKEKVIPPFSEQLKQFGTSELTPKKLDIFQINIGYMCNQVCEHCHVDAGPDRKEIMTKETMLQCLEAIKNTSVTTVDITGGAPEMNPNFRWLIEELKKLNIPDIIVRSNLTIIVSNKKFYDLPEFFKKHNIHIVSSLPCYTKENVDKQRGDGVFESSIKALKMLNEVGYGQRGTNLQLDLVYNPGGIGLPGNQQSLEQDYKRELKELFDIEFNHLFAITNLPISRFLDFLLASNRYEEYMNKLVEKFNPYAVEGVMCRDTISVSWDGFLFDCDFNQMLNLKAAVKNQHIKNFDSKAWEQRTIILGQHCYGCTAGEGSSCQGTLV